MSAKRRLSNGSKEYNLPVHETEDDEVGEDLIVSPKAGLSFGGGRRQSFGRRLSGGRRISGNTFEDNADQEKIAEMYKTIIKLSSENKINAKNSWNLDLINHMGSIIRDETSDRAGSRGINFQKASCTLDASIKIYSHRVDDTWSSSYRILSNLSRNELVDGSDGDDDNEEDEDGEQKVKKATRVGAKSSSNRHHMVTTIEKNVNNINIPLAEREGSSSSADPMFHKMSQAFDEGGAKGMLMANLRVNKDTATIVFSDAQLDLVDLELGAADTENDSAAPEDNSDSTTLSDSSANLLTSEGWTHGVAASQDLLDRCGIRVEDIVNRSVCSALERYRDSIEFIVPLRQTDNSYSSDLFAGLATVSSDGSINRITHTLHIASRDRTVHDNPIDTFDDISGDAPDYMSDEDDELVDGRNAFAAGEGRSPAHSSSSLSPSHNGKIQWDEVYSEAGSVMGDDDDDMASVSSRRSSVGGNWGEASYGYALQQQAANTSLSLADVTPIGRAGAFAPSKRSNAASATFLASMQLGGRGGSNQWAGARHWKSCLRKRTAGSTEQPPDTATKDTTKNKKRPTKEKFRFDFANITVGVSEQIDNCPSSMTSKGDKKTKSDATVMTAAAIQKSTTIANGGVYFLPEDAKINAKDLCRLFQWPALIVPPYSVTEGNVAQLSQLKLNSDATEVMQIICVPATTSHGIGASVGEDSLVGKVVSAKGEADVIWGSRHANALSTTATERGAASDLDNVADSNDGFDNDYDDDDEYGGDCGDSYEYEPSTHINQENVASSGLDIVMEGGMLQAARTVEKVSIGYATSSKRVNVRKLKFDMWKELDTSKIVDSFGTDENLPPQLSVDKSLSQQKHKAKSFQSLIQDINQQPGSYQKDASLPFYFICLLHLANEKNLHISDDRNTLDDLFISQESV